MINSTRVVITDGKDFLEVEPVDAAEHANHGWRRATAAEISEWKGDGGKDANDETPEPEKKSGKKIAGDVSAPVIRSPDEAKDLTETKGGKAVLKARDNADIQANEQPDRPATDKSVDAGIK